ncbi:hypothetical protein WR25_03561 [Diploscapter pachys]|uniref:DUF2878 domain-containing protein n=1 Tax=Diploscapter pachys TaxID=2018661 RepID=A0A2A2KF05_9BILA|nr:hypothetical protein WR25_03561 [Diploscapter pachys]
MTMPRAWLIANALWLQVGWWACVLGAKVPWLLLLVPLGMAVHLTLCAARGSEVRALLRVTLAGPLAYLGGARLADVTLPLGAVVTSLLLVPIWALALPLLVRLAARR